MPNNKIFVSYRRKDASGEAGRLVDDLQDVFGQESVFLDVETLEAGLDFVEAIDQALNSCKVLLAIIGPHWANIKDSEGNLRLFEKDDFIRIEIAAALERDIRVIPVLVNGAKMPSNSELPEELQALNRRHAHELSSSRWKYDTEQLVGILSKIIEPKKKPAPTPGPKPTPRPIPPKKEKSWFAKNYIWLLGGFVVIAILFSLGGEDFEEGYEEGYNEAVTGNPQNPTANEVIGDFETQQETEDSYIPPPPTVDNLHEQRIYELVDISGIWNLSLENELVSFLQITQSGYDVQFLEYNLLNVQVGNGSGFWEEGVLYLDYYSPSANLSGELELELTTSESLIGTLFVPATNYTANIRLDANN